jgi:hypothetical protein
MRNQTEHSLIHTCATSALVMNFVSKHSITTYALGAEKKLKTTYFLETNRIVSTVMSIA